MNPGEWGAFVTELLAYGGIAVEMVALSLIPFVLVRRKDPAATIAWILVLVFLPVVGATLFLLFGRSRVRWSARRKRQADEALQGHLIGFRKSPKDVVQTPLPLAGHTLGLFHASEVLARGKSTTGNHVDVLVGGSATYASIGEAIDAARHHVHAEYYLIRPDATGAWFFEKLIEASRRGVQVRLLCDGWGCFALPRSWLRRLRTEGVKVAHFFPLSSMLIQPVSLRNHRKIVVVDGSIGFTGGINIGDEYLGKMASVGAWRDTHVRVQGPAVAELQSVFLRDWFFSSQEVVKGSQFFRDEKVSDAAVAAVTSGPDTDSEAIHRIFFSAIAGARDKVLITTPYFVPDRSLLVALQMAAIQGVEVRIILPSRSNHTVTFHAGRSFYDDLIEAGVHIHEYSPGMIHAKTMVVDSKLSLVGSANMDLRSFRLNFEVHMLVADDYTAASLEAIFQADLERTTEVALDRWRARRVSLRVAEGAARLVSPLL